AQLARIDRRVLPGTERFHVPVSIRGRRIKLPAQTVVERNIRANLPTVLHDRVNAKSPYGFALRRPLRKSIGESQQILWVIVVVGSTNHVFTEPAESIMSIDVEVVKLVEAAPANIHAELHGVIPLDPS